MMQVSIYENNSLRCCKAAILFLFSTCALHGRLDSGSRPHMAQSGHSHARRRMSALEKSGRSKRWLLATIMAGALSNRLADRLPTAEPTAEADR